MEHDEGIHPASVGRPDDEIPTGRQVLAAGRVDPEPEDTEQDCPRE
jgi:hypothetical protein